MVRPREISLVLEKVEEGPYWDRLLASKVKQPWLRIDFKNWKDEDDDEEEGQGQDLGRLELSCLCFNHRSVFRGNDETDGRAGSSSRSRGSTRSRR